MDIVHNRRKTFSHLYIMTAISHVIYMVLFILEKCPFLVVINGGMISSFVANAVVAKKSDDYKALFKVGTVAMVLFLVVHFVALGPEYEFQYISLGSIPLIYFTSNIAGKDVKFSKRAALASFIFYCVMYAISFLIKYPLIEISYVSKIIIICVNTILGFGMAILFMSMFVIKTEADADALEGKNLDLENSANIDALTGLRNRRSIEN